MATHTRGPIVSKKGFRLGTKAANTNVVDEGGSLYQQGAKVTVSAAQINNFEPAVVTISVTNAEIKALNATPKVLVVAPGAGKFIEFLAAVLFHDYGTNALTGNHDMTIGLDAGTVAVAAVIGFADFPLKVADHVYAVKSAVGFNGAGSAVLNKNLALKAAGDFAGNAAADTVWKIKVVYRIHDFS